MEAHGWTLFAHPLFLGPFEKLVDRVEALAAADPAGYASHPAAKLLATIRYYILEAIPRNPNDPEFRQGNTLGRDQRHWFRAKFHGRYRLFYRFSSKSRIIIYVWINDENTLRKAGSKTDPYTVFQSMLKAGHPPASFDELLRPSRRLGK